MRSRSYTAVVTICDEKKLDSQPNKERRGRRCFSWVHACSPQAGCPLNTSLSATGPLSFHSTGIKAGHAPLQHTSTFFSFSKLPIDLQAAATPKAICPTWRVCNPQRSQAPPRRERGGQNTCLDIRLAYVCQRSLSREQCRLMLDDVLSKLEKVFKLDW